MQLQKQLLLLSYISITFVLATTPTQMQQRTETFAHLSHAQRLTITLSSTDHLAATNIYSNVCHNSTTPSDLRAIACNLQYAVPTSPPTTTVVGGAAAAELSSEIELEIEQIRQLDLELISLSLRETLSSDSAQIWLQLDKSISDTSSYNAVEIKETLDLRTSYGNIVLGLNQNITTALSGVKATLIEARADLNARITQLHKDASKQRTVGHLAEFAHGLLFVANMATGIANSGWSSQEELSKMDAGKAAAKEAKDHIGEFKTLLSILKGVNSQNGAHAGDDALTAAIEGVATQVETQLNVLDGVAALMGSMQEIADANVTLPTSTSSSGSSVVADRPLLENLNTTISSLAIQSAADSLVGSMEGTENGQTVEARARIDAFVGLVRARTSAINGWWNANSKLRQLSATTAMLCAEHEHLARQINTTTLASERASHATSLLRAHRRQRVNAVSQTLRQFLWTINYATGHRKVMEPFAEMTTVNQDLNNASAMVGALPIPGTAALSARHAKFIMMHAQGFVGGTLGSEFKSSSSSSSSASSASSSLIQNARPSPPSTSSLFHLSCWHVYTLKKEQLDLTALKRGEVVSFSIRFRPGTVLSTVTAVRAYALPHVLDSSELTEDTTNEATTATEIPQYITVTHLGESIIAGQIDRGGDPYATYAHNSIDFPFGYHPTTLCPVSDVSPEGTGNDEGQVHVNPSLYGAWTVQMLSMSNTSASTLTGVRIEFHTSSWSGSVAEDFNTTTTAIPTCDIPLQLQRTIANQDGVVADPHQTAAYVLIFVFVCAVLFLIVLTLLYKHKRVLHKRWRANTDIRDIEMELKKQEKQLYKAAAKKRRVEKRRKSLIEEQEIQKQDIQQQESRTSNPFRDFDRRPTDLTTGATKDNDNNNNDNNNDNNNGETNNGNKKQTNGRKRNSLFNRLPFFGTIAIALISSLLPTTANALSSLPFVCIKTCATGGSTNTYAQKELLLSMTRSGREYMLQGDNTNSEKVYSCCLSFANKCLNSEDAKEMSQLLTTAAHNAGTLERSPASQGDAWSDGSFLPSRLGFDVLEKLVRSRLLSVNDLDRELSHLENLNIVDNQILYAEGKRQLQTAESELQRDQANAEEATRTATVLKEEVKVLVSKYDEYMGTLSSNIQAALSAESAKIQQLNTNVANIDASKRKKTFWSGLVAGLETVAGAVCCSIGMPEVGIPLIIDGVDNAVTAAQTALAAPPPSVDEDKELKQKAIDTIANIKNLQSQALVVSTLVRNIADDDGDSGWSKSTLAKELPALFLLQVDQTSFSNYMNAFSNNLAATAGSTTEAVLKTNVRELSGTVTMIVKSITAYYPAYMDLQHAHFNHQLHIARVAQLRDLLKSGRTVENARSNIIRILQVRRDRHAVVALRTISKQRQRFVNYALDSSANMPAVFVSAPSTVAYADDSNPAPLDTKSILAAAVSNYIYVLKAQQQTPSQQAPQSCLVSYSVNATSHPTAFQSLQENGTLSLLFSPLTTSSTSNTNTNTNNNSLASPAFLVPGQRFAYDASITEMHVFIDFIVDDEKKETMTQEDSDTPLSKLSTMRIRIKKSGTDVRLDPYSTAVHYPTEPTSFEYVYESSSECPISSSQSTLSSDRTSTLTRTGTSPSMMGMWSITPLLAINRRKKISKVRILMRVEHKIGIGKNSDGTAATTSAASDGATVMLSGGAQGKNVDGVCGAVPTSCEYGIAITGSSAEGCNAGVAVSTNEKKHVAENSIWLGVIIGISIALVPTVLLSIWIGWRLIIHNREVDAQLNFFSIERESQMSGLGGKDSLGLKTVPQNI